MWRYFKGVSNLKRKQTPDERKAKDQEYEAKRRKRCFQDDWKKGRQWLTYDPEQEAMFCDYCIKAGVEPEKSSFVKGCTNIKFEIIRIHQTSNFHLYATQKHSNDQSPGNAPAVQAHLSLNKTVSKKLKILFRTTHALNIKARPMTDYTYITEMDIKKGLDIPGDRYKTRHACTEFTQAIADVAMQTIKTRFSKSKFVAVIVDGSMDSPIIHNEMVFIQTCSDGEVYTDFLRCCQVERGNAQGIMKAIKKAVSFLVPWEEFNEKLVALGSDGASVMLGRKNGVIALLQQNKPDVIGINHFLMILRISVSCIVINNDTYFRFSSKFTTLSWKQVITRFQDDYSKVLQLFDLVLTLPATSTACERGFSHMKLIKTDIRSSLSENTLSNSILIKLHSPTIGEFDPTPAIEHWLRQKERRPGTSGSKDNKKKGKKKLHLLFLINLFLVCS